MEKKGVSIHFDHYRIKLEGLISDKEDVSVELMGLMLFWYDTQWGKN